VVEADLPTERDGVDLLPRAAPDPDLAVEAVLSQFCVRSLVADDLVDGRVRVGRGRMVSRSEQLLEDWVSVLGSLPRHTWGHARGKGSSTCGGGGRWGHWGAGGLGGWCEWCEAIPVCWACVAVSLQLCVPWAAADHTASDGGPLPSSRWGQVRPDPAGRSATGKRRDKIVSN
jgi:hypothetical protein